MGTLVNAEHDTVLQYVMCCVYLYDAHRMARMPRQEPATPSPQTTIGDDDEIRVSCTTVCVVVSIIIG